MFSDWSLDGSGTGFVGMGRFSAIVVNLLGGAKDGVD